jgi:hypothetical protein
MRRHDLVADYLPDLLAATEPGAVLAIPSMIDEYIATAPDVNVYAEHLRQATAAERCDLVAELRRAGVSITTIQHAFAAFGVRRGYSTVQKDMRMGDATKSPLRLTTIPHTGRGIYIGVPFTDDQQQRIDDFVKRSGIPQTVLINTMYRRVLGADQEVPS